MSRLIKIENYDHYFVSDDGEVYSNNRILKKRKNKSGYYYVNLCQNGTYKSVSIHRLVGKYFVKNPNNYLVINHIDGNKLNNSFSNLEWCTQKCNTQEAFRLGLVRIRRGKECNLSKGKLNIDIANTIREKYKQGNISYGTLAKEYKCSKSAIIQIIQNKIYKI